MLGGNLSECRCLPPESLTAPLMVADVLEDQQACQKWRSAEVAYPGIGAFRDKAWKFHRPVSCRKYCSNVSSRSFLIHVSSGKLTQGMEERESVFFFFLCFCTKCDGELITCFLLVLHTQLFTLTCFVTGYLSSADITATWTLNINHDSFPISQWALNCTEAGWESGREGVMRPVASCCWSEMRLLFCWAVVPFLLMTPSDKAVQPNVSSFSH